MERLALNYLDLLHVAGHVRENARVLGVDLNARIQRLRTTRKFAFMACCTHVPHFILKFVYGTVIEVRITVMITLLLGSHELVLNYFRDYFSGCILYDLGVCQLWRFPTIRPVVGQVILTVDCKLQPRPYLVKG